MNEQPTLPTVSQGMMQNMLLPTSLTGEDVIQPAGPVVEEQPLSTDELAYEVRGLKKELAQQEVRENPYSPLVSGALGFLSGATLGFAPQAITGLGLMDQEKFSAYREEDPGAFLAGELTSFLVPGTGLIKGSGLVAKSVKTLTSPIQQVGRLGNLAGNALTKKLIETGAESTAKTVLSNAAGKGLGSAIEGAFYSAGQLLTDDALGDAQFNAETLLSRASLGSLLAGTFGAGFSFAGQGVKAFAKNYKPAIKKIGAKVMFPTDPKRGEEVFDFIADPRNLEDLTNIQKLPGDVDAKITAVVQAQADDAVSNFQRYNENYSTGIKSVLDDYKANGMSAPFKSIAKVIDDDIKELEALGAAAPQVQSQIKQLKNYKTQLIEKMAIPNLQKAALGKTLKNVLKDFKGSKVQKQEFLNRLVNNKSVVNELRITAEQLNEISKAMNLQAQSLFVPGRKATKADLAWNNIGRAAREQLDIFPGEAGKKLKQLNKQYGEVAESMKVLRKFGVGKDVAEDSIQEEALGRSLRDLLTGRTKTARDAKKALEVLDRNIGTNLARNQDLLSTYTLVNDGKLSSVLTGYSNLIPALSAMTGVSLGLSAPVVGAMTLAGAAVQSPFLRMPIIRGAQKAAFGVDKGLMYLTDVGDAVPQYLIPFLAAKVAGMGEIEREIAKNDEEIGGAINSFLEKKTAVIQGTRSRPELSKEDLLRLATDKQAFDQWFQEQTADLGLIYPSVIDPMKFRLQAQIEYAAQKLPKRQEFALDEEDIPTDQQQEEFDSEIEVLEDPRVIFAYMDENRLSPKHVNVLRTFYPQQHALMQQKLIESLKGRKLTYDQKQQISILMSQPMTAALRPDRFMALQQNFAAQNQDVQQGAQNDLKGLEDRLESSRTQGQRVQE